MKKRLPVEEIIKVWQTAESPDAAAEKLGLSRKTLDARIIHIKGLHKDLAAVIKKFSRKTLKDRVPELIKLAKSLS